MGSLSNCDEKFRAVWGSCFCLYILDFDLVLVGECFWA